MVNVAFNLKAFLREAEAEGVVVSFCPELGIYSQGRTADEARTALRSAVSLWVKNCYDRRVLDTALYEAGFRRTDATGVENAPGTITVNEAPGNDFGDEFNIEVPLCLLARASGGEVSV